MQSCYNTTTKEFYPGKTNPGAGESVFEHSGLPSDYDPAGHWMVDDSSGTPIPVKRPQTDIDAIAAEGLKETLVRITAHEVLRRICAQEHPLKPGKPISSSTDPATMRFDALITWANCRDYKDRQDADPTVVSTIDATIAEKDRLLAVGQQIDADIEAGTITTDQPIYDDNTWSA
jgi:hypothetical protein